MGAPSAVAQQVQASRNAGDQQRVRSAMQSDFAQCKERLKCASEVSVKQQRELVRWERWLSKTRASAAQRSGLSDLQAWMPKHAWGKVTDTTGEACVLSCVISLIP